MENIIIPYYEVSASTLQDVSKRISSVPIDVFHKQALICIQDYFKDIPGFVISESAIETGSLLGVENSCLVLRSNGVLADGCTPIRISGVARLLSPQGNIPTVFLFEDASSIVLQHEQIHLCQYLLPSHYPMSNEQFKLLMKSDILSGVESLEGESVHEAMDFAINSICYKMWIELEANYYALDVERTKEYDLWAYKSYRSSLPYESFEDLSTRDGWGSVYENKGFEKLDEFFRVVSNSSKWIDGAVAKAGYESLPQMLSEMRERLIEDSLFGPITDEDIERFRIESEKQSDL